VEFQGHVVRKTNADDPASKDKIYLNQRVDVAGAGAFSASPFFYRQIAAALLVVSGAKTAGRWGFWP
jgi:hypothetical protein